MKIYVVGTSGSGKSTLARHISHLYKIPHIELDELHFLPGWIERPDEDFKTDAVQAMTAPHWTMCGNYSSILPTILDHAELIVWLKYPFPKVFWRTLKRTFRRVIFREPCCNGNYESFYQQFFTKYSIFWWVIKTHNRRKKKYTALSHSPEHKDKWVTLKNEQDVKNWIPLLTSFRVADTRKPRPSSRSGLSAP